MRFGVACVSSVSKNPGNPLRSNGVATFASMHPALRLLFATSNAVGQGRGARVVRDGDRRERTGVVGDQSIEKNRFPSATERAASGSELKAVRGACRSL